MRRRSVPCNGANSRAGAEAGSLAEPIFQQHPERDEAVAPGNLLAFVVAPAVVGDWHLVNPELPLEDLRGELGLDAEAVRLQAHRPQDLRPQDRKSVV